MPKEQFPENKGESKHALTENVLNGLHELSDGVRAGSPHTPDKVRSFHNEAEELIHQAEEGTLYDLHERGEHINLEHIGVSVEIALESIDKALESPLDVKEIEELTGARALLSSRVSEIKNAAIRYAESVEKHVAIKKKQGRMDVEEFKESLIRLDRDRKIKHDRLIEALKTYNSKLTWLVESGYLEEGVVKREWGPGMTLQTLDHDVKAVYVFTGSFLENRGEIQGWGVAEAFRNYVRMVDAEMKKAREGGATTP